MYEQAVLANQAMAAQRIQLVRHQGDLEYMSFEIRSMLADRAVPQDIMIRRLQAGFPNTVISKEMLDKALSLLGDKVASCRCEAIEEEQIRILHQVQINAQETFGGLDGGIYLLNSLEISVFFN